MARGKITNARPNIADNWPQLDCNETDSSYYVNSEYCDSKAFDNLYVLSGNEIVFFRLQIGVTNVQAGDAFDLTPRAISKAKADTDEQKDFSRLSLPTTSRDKMKDFRDYLDDYFASVGPVSGIFLLADFPSQLIRAD